MDVVSVADYLRQTDHFGSPKSKQTVNAIVWFRVPSENAGGP
jgi:hypothetical protein